MASLNNETEEKKWEEEENTRFTRIYCFILERLFIRDAIDNNINFFIDNIVIVSQEQGDY
jgi:hypothetical protein